MAELIKTNGDVIEITPENGKIFTLEEAQKYVDGYYVELVKLKHHEMLICNEEAICYNLPYNHIASGLLADSYGDDCQALYGDIIHCKSNEF